MNSMAILLVVIAFLLSSVEGLTYEKEKTLRSYLLNGSRYDKTMRPVVDTTTAIGSYNDLSYCPANQECQWLQVLFIKLSETYKR